MPVVVAAEPEAEPRPAATNGKRAPTPADLVAVWNANRGPLPECKSLGTKREAAARVRLRELPDLGEWAVIVRRIAASSFCRGGGGRGWIAGIDFVLRADTHRKVVEGAFDDRAGPASASDAKVDHFAGRDLFAEISQEGT